MLRQNYYRKLFLIGAWWNWIVTVVFAFAYKAIFPLFSMPFPTYPAFFMMFLGLAFVFGIGYYWVSQDIGKITISSGWGFSAKYLSLLLLFGDGLTARFR